MSHDQEGFEPELGGAAGQPTYFMYEDGGQRWRWFLLDAQRRKIANSGRGYRSRADCLASIDLVRLSADAGLREP
ncbi:DUF1508 domain-containing protein [Steroidobacter flavus]|uniref:DUF1508 domain-containing protein n=1 Tax=Steroidobacter flavus TaxID=1842136 RepID=A0ABV8T1Y7_9GAMM